MKFGRFGLMHLLSTNVVFWIRILVKESLHEISDILERHYGQSHYHNGTLGYAAKEISSEEPCIGIPERILEYEHRQVECLQLHNDLLGHLLLVICQSPTFPQIKFMIFVSKKTNLAHLSVLVPVRH